MSTHHLVLCPRPATALLRAVVALWMIAAPRGAGGQGTASPVQPRGQPSPAAMRPCMTPEYHAFDFWTGQWDVYGATGTLVGHNDVTVEQDGCLLVEHWTTAPGGPSGSSFNYYDIRDRKWHQLYIDNSGNAGAYPAMSGGLANGRMVMLTADTTNTMSRWTWYVMEPGKVKQMAEVSHDHGVTWQVTWNSVYATRDSTKR